MKVLLGHLDWGLGTKGLHSDPGFWVCLLSAMFLSGQTFVKNGVKTSIAGSCTI